MRILRLLRGIAVSAITWTVVLIPIWIAVGAIASLFGAAAPPRELWRFLLVRQAIAGAISGAAFGATLAAVGRRQSFATLSLTRVAICGALGGAVFPLLMVGVMLRIRQISIVHVPPLPVFQLVLSVAVNSATGALWAASSFQIARRAPESRIDSGKSPILSAYERPAT